MKIFNRHQMNEVANGTLRASGAAWFVGGMQAEAAGTAGSGITAVGVILVVAIIGKGVQAIYNAAANQEYNECLRDQGATDEEIKYIESVLKDTKF